MSINFSTNAGALKISNYIAGVNAQLNKSLERLSTNSKLNHASDGPGNIAIAVGFDSQIRGYTAGSTNIQQGLSFLDTADSSMQQIGVHLQNIRDIAVAASNSTTTAAQFTGYQNTLQAELAAIDNISTNTKVGTNVLLNGSISGAAAAFNIQYGPNTADAVDIKTAFSNNISGAAGYAITQNTLATTANAGTLLTQVDTAITTLGTKLSTIGRFQSTLNDQLNVNNITQANLSAAVSRIRDTDVAAETANVTRLQILQQTGAYALGQVNNTNKLLLQLLQ